MLLDAQNTPSVDEAWDMRSELISEEESQIDFIAPASPRLERLPKAYFYSGREVSGEVDFELLNS